MPKRELKGVHRGGRNTTAAVFYNPRNGMEGKADQMCRGKAPRQDGKFMKGEKKPCIFTEIFGFEYVSANKGQIRPSN